MRSIAGKFGSQRSAGDTNVIHIGGIGRRTGDVIIENIIFLDRIIEYLFRIGIDDQAFPLPFGRAHALAGGRVMNRGSRRGISGGCFGKRNVLSVGLTSPCVILLIS